MPDLFSEVELGEQRPKDALGGGSSGSSVSLARASGDPLVDLHEGGRSNRGEGTGDAPANAPSSSAAARRRRPWSSWPHPLCNVAAVALGLLSAVLLVTTLVSSSSSLRNGGGRGPLLTAGQGCGTDRNCSSPDGSMAPEGGLHSSVSLAASRDFRGRPRSVVVAPASFSPSSEKDASSARTGSGGNGGRGGGNGGGGGGGVVAADHGRCSDVGAAVLSRGGNAADAAVAAALCQGVYNPMASGIGGGTIIMWRRGKGRRKKKRGGSAKNSSLPSDEEVIDGRETAPAAISAAAFEGGDPSLSLDGGLAVATPMELAALSALFERHGSRKVSWRELVAPAAAAARSGFEAHPYYVSAVSGPRTLERLRRSPELREAFLVRDPKAREKRRKGGAGGRGGGGGGEEEEGDDEEARNWRPPRVGERCCSRPALADTLDAVGREGASRGFYRSERAAQVAEDVRRAGGVLSAEDLGGAAPRVAEPLRSRASRSSSSPPSPSPARPPSSSPLWGMTLLVPPPPSAGASLLLAAAVAAGFEQPLPFGRGLGSHRLVEAMKHGMALRAALGDPGGGEPVAFGALGCGDGREGETGRRRGRRALLAAAAGGENGCGGRAPPPPRPRLFEGTSHVPALLADAADPSFAGLLRSEVNDSSTHRDPASYGGRWGVGGGGDGSWGVGGGGDGKSGAGGGGGGARGESQGGVGGRRRRRRGRKYLLDDAEGSASAAVVSLPPDDHGTSALVVVDADRNAVSLTTTVNTAFGSGVYSRRTGVLLNNQMDDFSVKGRSNGYGLPPGPANLVEPGKRPLSSMAPCMLVQEEDEEDEEEERLDDPTHGLRLVAGASGGPRILTALLQALVSVVEGGSGPLEAVSAPRLHHQLLPADVFAERWDAGGVREEVAAATLAALESRGHSVKAAGWGAVVQAVVVPQGGGPLEAACDPRKDGAPAVSA
jgi:gamma-glutamyltranspeptidase